MNKKNKKKWLNPDEIYVSPYTDRWIARKPVILRCKWCSAIIYSTMTPFYEKGYCSEWCWEMENPPKLRHFCKNPLCEAVITVKIKKKDGTSSGYFPKFCEDCKAVGLCVRGKLQKWLEGHEKK